MLPTRSTRPPIISWSTLGLQFDLAIGLALDLGADPLDDFRVELDRARQRHLELPVLLGPELVDRSRIRKIAGIRCFSASSSRKLTSSGSAPETARRIPSRFSAEEK